MKVYFTASLTGKNKYEKEYVQIVSALKDQKNIVFEHILTTSKELTKKESLKEKENVYQKMMLMLRKADIVIAEITYPSINVGHEISLSLALGKPVIALYLEGTNPGLLGGDTDEKLHLHAYTEETINKIIKEVISKAQEQIDIRFNFFISPEVAAYLDWVSKTRRLPRSVYLRNILEKVMREDKQYNEEISGE